MFFRNNHFNVLLKKHGQLYILVTDQGYQNEADIVWEHLSAVDNDTEFVGWNFGIFSPHAEAATGFVDPEDADFKLAQQLQLEEDARATRHEEQRREEQAAAQRTRRKKERVEKKEKKSICSVM